jgi:hypothetical protein
VLWTVWGALVLCCTWIAGLLFGAGVAVLAAAAAVVVARRPRVRAWLEHAEQLAGRRRRCADRETRLVEARAPTHGLDEATRLAREVEACDPVIAHYLDLEALLDRYVVAAVQVQRCERALALTRRDSVRESPLRDELEERQWDARTQLQMRISAYRDELEEIPEVFCLLLQRSVLDATELVDDLIGEQLRLHGEVSESLQIRS